jgi:hypothetical protein
MHNDVSTCLPKLWTVLETLHGTLGYLYTVILVIGAEHPCSITDWPGMRASGGEHIRYVRLVPSSTLHC